MDFSNDYRRSGELLSAPLIPPARDELRQRIESLLSVDVDLVDRILTAIDAGKHLLMYGPPGTGKTTLAELITLEYSMEPVRVTASADWTAFETAGGLQLGFEGGKETLTPQAGIITDAVVRCLNNISRAQSGEEVHKGAWLVIDELNRANMDAAFGPYFNALDVSHPRVTLPFMDLARREIVVPSRFRVIGTMNTYDKNFLFRLSYALTRRFALIEVGVPANDDESGRDRERKALLSAAAHTLGPAGGEATVSETYGSMLTLLYDTLVTKIRSHDEGGLDRGIGFAEISETFLQAVIAVSRGYVDGDDDDQRRAASLDRAVSASIVPQLEGLPNSRLRSFTEWWAANSELATLHRSLRATRALISGLDLFVSEQDRARGGSDHETAGRYRPSLCRSHFHLFRCVPAPDS